MRTELLDYYERELVFLRSMGNEFARKYPRVANRLMLESDRCEDPHVERLIESFAFMAARLHLRLDDDFPEITSSLLNLIYPHYLRPTPAMTVVECQIKAEHTGKQSTSVILPKDTLLNTRGDVDGMKCRFTTTYPIELWPIAIADCTWRTPEQLSRPVRVPNAVAALRMVVRGNKDVKPGTLGISFLRFYISGESNVALTLYELLASKCISILLRDPNNNDGRVVAIPPSALKPIGFDEDESLLPYPKRSYDGYRLLQEYFAFPQKFLFIELSELEALEAFASCHEIEVLIYFGQFERPERQQILETGVSANTLRLGCAPAINLFKQSAEPILLTETRHEYPIIADVRYNRMMELFSIDSVDLVSPSKRLTKSVSPFYAYRYNTLTAGQGIFWHANRRRAQGEEREPSSVFLSLVDLNGAIAEPRTDILTIRCTCTNHDLPSRLNLGIDEGDFEAENFANVQQVRALHRPTPSLDSPPDKGIFWRLISQLSLNYLSLGEEGLSALQEILRIHNFSQSPQIESQIAGLLSMRSKRHFSIIRTDYGSTPARGTYVELEIDERQFAHGGAYLFASVIERFLGAYVSMNSFCQLQARTNLRKEDLGRWTPRAGSRALL